MRPSGYPEFRFDWRDQIEDSLKGASYELPPNPWVIGVTLGDDFVDGLAQFSEYLPNEGNPFMAGVRELADRTGIPVDEWHDCPLCRGGMDGRVEGAAWCGTCRRVFTDSNLVPQVDRSPDRFGSPIDVVPMVAPLLIEIEQGIGDLPQVWIVKPPGTPRIVPDTFKDLRVLWAASGHVPEPRIPGLHEAVMRIAENSEGE